jgi:ribosomal protein L11 methylase PrmA
MVLARGDSLTEPETSTAGNASSFRDPQSGVIGHGTEMLRFFRGQARSDFEALRSDGLFEELAREGRILPLSQPQEAALALARMPKDALVISQPKLPFISHPYEWPFSMLREAALFHLNLLERALMGGAIIKDATSYNIQFVGTRPVFIDLGSFQRHTDGAPWGAYTQFCNLFLNPLLLQAYVGVGFQLWLRSSLEGIPAGVLSRYLPLRAKLRPAIFTNVTLQAFLQARLGSATPRELGVTPIVPQRAVVRHVRKLRDLIAGLTVSRHASEWAGYAEVNSYSTDARARKAAFVEAALARTKPATVWDLGTNSGDYAMLASRYASTVVAMDSDATLVDTVYARALRAKASVLALVMDMTNPSPDQGWDQRERAGLAERGPADLVLALALVHHLRFRGNVPTRHFMRWLNRIARHVVVEFIPKTDPEARRLLAWRDDVYDDYDEHQFEGTLSEQFAVEEKLRLPESERVLYAARARS